mgnify:CR=1 FL=1
MAIPESDYARCPKSVALQPYPKYGRIRMIERWVIVACHWANWVGCLRAHPRLRRETRTNGRCTSAFILQVMCKRNETCKPRSLPMVNPAPWYATNLTRAMLPRWQLTVKYLPGPCVNRAAKIHPAKVGILTR